MGTYIPKQAGQVLTLTTPPHRDGDEFKNTGRDVIFVYNLRAQAIKLIVFAKGTCSQGQLHNVEVSIPSGDIVLTNRFDQLQFNDASGSLSFQLVFDAGGGQLPDDDGQGHPDGVAVDVIRM